VTPETLFVEAWKAGVELKPDGDRLLLDAPSKPPQELLDKLAEHKSALLRFLASNSWIDTPLAHIHSEISLEPLFNASSWRFFFSAAKVSNRSSEQSTLLLAFSVFRLVNFVLTT